jgi:cephalosporin hydroxylase
MEAPTVVLDLSRVELIRNAVPADLLDSNSLEKLIVRLGFNIEKLKEQPYIVKENGGGLRIWQYPNQFSKYLLLLQKQAATSYIEIGCRWGGTYILTTEYLKRFNKVDKSVAVDIIDSPVATYCSQNGETSFMRASSKSDEFKDYIKNNKFDIVFIDGDHSYGGVTNDYEATKEHGKVFVFHDIVSDACPGVVKFWNELKEKESQTYDFFEFTEQYDDVWENTQQKFLGIGVAVKK